MRRVVNFIFVFIVALFLTACGGGGGSTGGTSLQPDPVTLNGVAVDNYISGATVCIDTDKDNDCADEISSHITTTNSSGYFSFSNVTPSDDMVIIAYGGTDAITGETFSYIIKNIATNKDSNNTVILSSINTLITDYKFENNTTLDDAKTKVVTFLGVDSTKAIQDVIANKSTNATEFLRSLKLFQMIATINDVNNSTSSALSFKKLAQAIGSNTSLQHDQNMTINSRSINSSTSYTPVLLSGKEFFYYSDMSPGNQFPIEACDPNNRSLTYTMINLKDYDDFNISGANLSFKTAKTSITNPTDSNGDGIYEVDVNISNGVTSTIKTFTVTVKNYNRTTLPTLSSNYILSAEDNMTVNTILGSISPTSVGTNDAIIKYELNATDYFDINQSNGNFFVNETLPVVAEGQSQQIPLKLRVLNSAGWSSYADLNVTVYHGGELNTTATIVATTFETIYENNSSSQTIGTVQVGITGGHTVTNFKISSGDSNGDFNISSAGELTTVNGHSFDYENVNGNTYELYVEANNTNGWGTASKIIVKIKDVNEVPYITGTTVSSNVIGDQNVSFEETKTLRFTLNDGDRIAQNMTIETNSSNEGNITVSKSRNSGVDGDTFDVNLTGVAPGRATITVKVTDDGNTSNGGVNTKSYIFTATVRSNGWKYYDERTNNDEHNITFDAITYTWKPDKKWYETTNTILMPVQILKSARNAYIAGNFKEVAEGHYYVNKADYIWDVNKSQTHTDLMKYKNANGVDNNITAKNNYFQHDAYHNFFVSMITNTSATETQYRTYNNWTKTNSNFIDANDSNNTYSTGEIYSQYFIQTNNSDSIKQVDTNNTSDSVDTECARMYGKGWRIPTAYEMGLTSDNTIAPLEGTNAQNSGYIPAYVGNQDSIIFSSSKNGTAYSSSYSNTMVSLRQLSANYGIWEYKGNDQEGAIRCVYQP